MVRRKVNRPKLLIAGDKNARIFETLSHSLGYNVILQVGKAYFPSFKSVLIRNEYFKAMFANPTWSENDTENQIEICYGDTKKTVHFIRMKIEHDPEVFDYFHRYLFEEKLPTNCVFEAFGFELVELFHFFMEENAAKTLFELVHTCKKYTHSMSSTEFHRIYFLAGKLNFGLDMLKNAKTVQNSTIKVLDENASEEDFQEFLFNMKIEFQNQAFETGIRVIEYIWGLYGDEYE